MPDESLTVDARVAGWRLDRLVAGMGSVGSRRRASEAVATGKVDVNGQPCQDGARVVVEGDRVELSWTRPGTARRRVEGRDALDRAGVRVIHQDEHLAVVDKPAGLLTDAATEAQRREEDTLRKRVRGWLGEAHVVHRIDRDTTGLVLFARTTAAAAHLDAQFASRRPERVYLAVVQGAMQGDSGHFADWMYWDRKRRIQRVGRPEGQDAVLAEADWTVRERFGVLATLIEVRLVTGRRNQIRLHAQLAGHPLVGERLYVAEDAEPWRGPRMGRQALHAHRLGLVHPGTGKTVRYESPLPEDMASLLADLRRAARA